MPAHRDWDDDFKRDLNRMARTAIRSRSGVGELVDAHRRYVQELEELMECAIHEDSEIEVARYRGSLAAEREKLDKLLESVSTAEEESPTLRRAIDLEEERLGQLITADEVEPPSEPRFARRVGTNLRGVPVYEGGRPDPSLSECHEALVSGALMTSLGLLAFVDTAPLRHPTPISVVVAVLAMVAIFAGIISIADGIGLLRQRARLIGLVSIAVAEEQFKVPALTLLLVARQKGIEPKCIINGTEYFDFTDFGDAATLLRAAELPRAEDENLLHPVTRTDSNPKILLRATNDETQITIESPNRI
jgi:hypothetical protein